MTTRLFFINLGITCLAAIILYLYFRNRIGRIEQKVDLMFQLIQEYNQNQNPNPQQMSNMSYEHRTVTQENPDDLINVSDDDDDDRESDSEEVSDDENDDTIPLSISSVTLASTIKSINLAGAEIDSLHTEAPDDLDDISELDDIENNVITLDEVDEFQNEEEYVEEHAEQHVAQHVETITKVNSDIKQVNVTEEEEEEEEEEENKSLANCSVKELKEKCKNQGFTNYKGLRKNKLVELLEKKPTAENHI